MRNESFTCDRCSQVFIKEDKETKYKVMTLKEVEDVKDRTKKLGSVALLVFHYTNTGLDLCKKCNSDLDNWLNNAERKTSQ